MASSSSSSSTCFHLVFLMLLPLVSLSHAFMEEQSDSSFPGYDLVDCGPRLLTLAPCAPFVQGSLLSPALRCCDNLLDLYDQQPDCLCTLLNETTFASFPINKTLALQLPLLCNLEMNISSCPGLVSFPGSASPQVPDGANANSSSTAASPTVAMAPMFNMGFGIGQNAAGAELKIGELLLGVIAVWLLEAFSLI